MAKLVIREGRRSGTELVLGDKERFVIGRRSSNDLQILDAKASRNHAEIIREGSTYILRDLKSRNGTLLNNTKVTSDVELEFSDEIRIGDCVIALVDEAADKPITIEIPGYEMISRVGEGSMGTVYKARQVSMDRVVALKVLSEKYSSAEKFIERFIKEARAAGKLSHPNLIHVHDVSKAGGRHYFSMEFVDGTTVRKMLRKGAVEPKKAAAIILQAAKGLGYAHENNIIHRDVKPDNLMVDREKQVKLSDLGIARSLEEEAGEGHRRKVFGTPHYMAPEQALGKPIDARADAYSLGATLYHMLTGETPFEGTEPTEVLKAHVQTAPPDIREKKPEVPEVLAKIVEKMMAKAPDRRYQKMSELAADLEKFIEEGPDVAPAPAPVAEEKEKPEKKPRRRRGAPEPMPGWMTAVVGVAVAIGLGALGVGTYYVVSKFKKDAAGEEAPRILARAVRLEEDGKPEVAREFYGEIVERFPGTPWADEAQAALDRLSGAEPPTPPPEGLDPSELLKSAKKLEADEDLEGAKRAYEQIVTAFADSPEAAEAKPRVEEITRLIREKKETAASRLFAEAESHAREHVDDVAGQILRYRKVLDDYPETAAAVKARARLSECEKRLEADEATQAQNAYASVRRAAITRRARGDFDGAIQELDAFIARYVDYRELVDKAKSMRAEFKAEIQQIYADVERSARDDARRKYYGMALEKLKQFIKRYKSREEVQKAQALMAEINKQSREDFEQAVKEPNKLALAFEFDGAINLYNVLDNQFRGTQWQVFAKYRIGQIENQRELHEKVVDKLTEMWEEYQETKDRTKLHKFPEKVGRQSWYVAGATMGHVTVRSGAGGALDLARDLPWKSLKAKVVYAVYLAAFPFDECDVDLHEMFDFFCQERDLVDEAEKHRVKYDEEE